MNFILNKINKIWILILLGLMFYQLIVNGVSNTLPKNLILLSIIPLSFLPRLVNKFLKYNMSEVLKFFYYLFIFIALVCGSILGFYTKISWFDLFAHFLSGIVFSLVGLIIISKFGIVDKKYVWFNVLVIICFTLATACFWEFFEFFSDLIFKTDTQWVKKTGVSDTMTDMLIAFLGSILFSIYYLFNMKFNSSKFVKFLKEVL